VLFNQPVIAKAPQSNILSGWRRLNENSIVASISPDTPKAQPSATVGQGEIYEKRVLACIIGKESSGNEEALNPHDTDGFPKFGLLQFHYFTFEEWCVKKYGMDNDIYNGEIQKECYCKMIEDGQSFRWPSYKKCL